MTSLTNRDRELLKKIASVGMLSTRQIGETFFKGVVINTVLRRLRKLEARSFLKRLSGLETHELLWIIAPKGASSINADVFKSHWSKNMIEHDYKLISLRMLLERAGIAHSWIPEHEIRSMVFKKYGLRQSQKKLIPDGLMGVDANKKMESVAIELELTVKSKKRYQNIIYHYVNKNNLHAVWYIVPTSSILNSLKEIWKKHSSGLSNIKVYFSLLSDLMANPMETKLFGLDSTHLLSELWTPLSLMPAHVPAQRVSTLDQKYINRIVYPSGEDHTPILGINY